MHNPNELNPRPFVFQQDNAPSYTSKWTLCQLAQDGIKVLEHVSNSPDMNAIEGAWMPMRIAITQDQNEPRILEQTNRAQQGEWAKIPQDRIQAMVARIAAINQLIIEYKRGNEFHRQCTIYKAILKCCSALS